MMGILLDTSFLISFYNERESNHKLSIEFSKELEKNKYGKVFTSTFVLDEFFTYMQRKIDTEKAYEIAKSWIMENKGIAEIKEINWNIFYKSFQRFYTQKSQRRPLSFTDCTNIQFSMYLQIEYIATFDLGFEGHMKVLPG